MDLQAQLSRLQDLPSILKQVEDLSTLSCLEGEGDTLMLYGIDPNYSTYTSSHHWVGLCCLTESNRPYEWPYIAWVIRNRLDSGKYKHTYEQVVLQPSQFSAFNKWQGTEPLTIFQRVSRGYHSIELLFHAVDIARKVIESGDNDRPFPITVRHYYSPISMRPLGRKPPWYEQAKKVFTPEGLDPERFVFADGVLP